MSKNQGLGNPLVVAALAPSAAKAANGSIDFVAKNGKNIITLVAFGVALYYGRKEYIKWSIQKFLEKNGDNPDVITAMIFYKAMHKDWTIDTLLFSYTIPDGTDEDVLNEYALKVSSLRNVVKAYKKIFRLNLHTDIRSELNTKELIGFYERLKAHEKQKVKDAIPFDDFQPYIAGQTLVVTSDKGTLLRKAIYDTSKNTISMGKVLKTIPYGDSAYKIKQVLVNSGSSRISYVVDIPWDIWDDGIVDHRDVEPK